MDDLSRIERNYGCYAEYARQREEDEAYEYEQQEKRNEYARQNKEKLSKAEAEGKAVFNDDCYGCPSYEDIGPTWWNSWDQDDFPHGICHFKGKCERRCDDDS